MRTLMPCLLLSLLPTLALADAGPATGDPRALRAGDLIHLNLPEPAAGELALHCRRLPVDFDDAHAWGDYVCIIQPHDGRPLADPAVWIDRSEPERGAVGIDG